jgi:hypothetical protein
MTEDEAGQPLRLKGNFEIMGDYYAAKSLWQAKKRHADIEVRGFAAMMLR